MPSEKILKGKQQQVAELHEQLLESIAGVVVDYRGINVANDTKLRTEARQAGVDYHVVKNSLLRLAVKDTALEELTSVFEGTTAIALSKEDPVAAAKILQTYADSSKGKFKVKAGFVEGRVLDAADVNALAKLPSREVLVAQVLGGLNAPITSFVYVLQANLRGLVVALNAIAEQKSA